MEVQPIGFVAGGRPHATDDNWGGTEACIELSADYPSQALAGLAAFSHVEVLFAFHQVEPVRIETGARHPRNNPAWPREPVRQPAWSHELMRAYWDGHEGRAT